VSTGGVLLLHGEEFYSNYWAPTSACARYGG